MSRKRYVRRSDAIDAARLRLAKAVEPAGNDETPLERDADYMALWIGAESFAEQWERGGYPETDAHTIVRGFEMAIARARKVLGGRKAMRGPASVTSLVEWRRRLQDPSK